MPKFNPDIATYPLNEQVGPFCSLVDGEFVTSAALHLRTASVNGEDLGMLGDRLEDICLDYQDGFLPQQEIDRFWRRHEKYMCNHEVTPTIALEDLMYNCLVAGDDHMIDLLTRRFEYDARNGIGEDPENALNWFLTCFYKARGDLRVDLHNEVVAEDFRRKRRFNETVSAIILAGVLLVGTITFREPIKKIATAYHDGGAKAALEVVIGTPQTQIQGR